MLRSSCGLLPGLAPTHLLAGIIQHRPFDETMTHVLMSAITLFALIGFTWIGSRGPWQFVGAAALALALSLVNSWMAYQLFAA